MPRIYNEVIEYKGFKIEFIFPHYYVYYNEKKMWQDMGIRDCQVWIDELMDWLLEDYSVVTPSAPETEWPIDY